MTTASRATGRRVVGALALAGALAIPWAPAGAQDTGWTFQLDRAQVLLDGGDYAAALSLFDAVIELVPQGEPTALAWAHFGRAYAGQQLEAGDPLGLDLSRYVADYRLAGTLDPERYAAAASFNAGLIHSDLGQGRQALTSFVEAATQEHPARARFYLEAGRAYAGLGMPDSAAWGYRRAMEEDPSDDEAPELLLGLLADQQRDSEMLALASRLTSEGRSLRYVGHVLTTALRRPDPPLPPPIAEDALLLTANGYARTWVAPSHYVRTAAADLDAAAQVHPSLGDAVRTLGSAYRPRERGAPFSLDTSQGWWIETLNRHRAWSSVVRSLGDLRWLDDDFDAARSYYELAVGFGPRPYTVQPWVDRDGLTMLSSVLARQPADLDALDGLVGGVDRWLGTPAAERGEADRNAARDVLYNAGSAYVEERLYPPAIALYERSLDVDPAFTPALVGLGFVFMESDMARARTLFERAVTVDPEEPTANNNLGFASLVLGDFDRAVQLLERSYAASPYLLNTINLGDAYRFSGDTDSALGLHLEALEGIESRADDEVYMATGWRYNYMPLGPGDTVTPNHSVLVRTVAEKRAFVHHALAFDYALLGDLANAQAHLSRAQASAQSDDFRCFFANKIAAIEGFLDAPGAAAQWFAELRRSLREGLSCADARAVS